MDKLKQALVVRGRRFLIRLIGVLFMVVIFGVFYGVLSLVDLALFSVFSFPIAFLVGRKASLYVALRIGFTEDEWLSVFGWEVLREQWAKGWQRGRRLSKAHLKSCPRCHGSGCSYCAGTGTTVHGM